MSMFTCNICRSNNCIHTFQNQMGMAMQQDMRHYHDHYHDQRRNIYSPNNIEALAIATTQKSESITATIPPNRKLLLLQR